MADELRISADDEEVEQEDEQKEKPGCLSIFYHLFEDPAWFHENGNMGQFIISQIVNWIVNILILVSTASFCMSSLPRYSKDKHLNPENWELWEDRWRAIEVTCVLAFTFDFCVRCFGSLGSGHFGDFVRDKLNYIDIIAIVPWYIEEVTGYVMPADGFRFIRVMRLVRILRSMPGAKHGNLADIIGEIIRSSQSALLVPVYFMSLAVIVFASITYYTEQPTNTICNLPDGTKIDDWYPTKEYNPGCEVEYACQCPGTIEYEFLDGQITSDIVFDTIPNAMWWCIVSFTTVGYGDIAPQTMPGKLVGTLTMVTGVFFMAMPLAIVGDSFITTYNKLTEKKKAYAIEQALLKYDVQFTKDTWVPRPDRVSEANDDVVGHLSRVSAILDKLAEERREDDEAPDGSSNVWSEASDLVKVLPDKWDAIYTKLLELNPETQAALD